MRKMVLFFILFAGISLKSKGQHTSGYLKYHVDIEVIDTTQETLRASRMLRDSKIEMYFNVNKYRLNTKMGTLYTSSVVHDGVKEETIVLSVNRRGKFAQLFTKDDVRKKDIDTTTTIVVERRDSTRKIVGFDCFYVQLIRNADTSHYWCSEAITFQFDGNDITDKDLPAFPLSIRKIAQGFEFTYTVSNFKIAEDFGDTIFSTDVPKGFSLIPTNPPEVKEED